jgi:hypothetical protein
MRPIMQGISLNRRCVALPANDGTNDASPMAIVAVLVCVLFVLALTCGWLSPVVAASPLYTDGATSQWFKSLASPYARNCCDQSDCALAESDYHDGSWWALSNRTKTWVPIQPNQITETVSIFPKGVLCEGDPLVSYQANGVIESGAPRVYCFAPPPIGF